MTNTEPSSGRSPYAARKHDHHNPLAGGKVVPSEALAASGEPSSDTFLRGDNSWAEIPVAPDAADIGDFDPNENPVIIGALSTAGGGSTPDDVSLGTTKAVAIGYHATGSGATSVAIGSLATATAIDGVAIGRNADVTAAEGVAVGENSAALGVDGAAFGALAVATGVDSTALGYHANANVDRSVAIGNSSVDGTDGVAIGTSAYSASTNAVAAGNGATANGTNSTALGEGTSTAFKAHATALGAGATNTKANQVMLGTSADFVEIPGNGAANGLVLKDTVTGTRYIVQITSGALVLNAAP